MKKEFRSDIEILELLKKYFKGLALHWEDDNICLVDDNIDLLRLAKFLYNRGED